MQACIYRMFNNKVQPLPSWRVIEQFSNIATLIPWNCWKREMWRSILKFNVGKQEHNIRGLNGDLLFYKAVQILERFMHEIVRQLEVFINQALLQSMDYSFIEQELCNHELNHMFHFRISQNKLPNIQQGIMQVLALLIIPVHYQLHIEIYVTIPIWIW